MFMKKIIVGNWKMNPVSLDEAKRIYKLTKKAADKLTKIDVVACPPFVYVPLLSKVGSKSSVALGVQNIFYEEQGSFTGEISARMLKDLGVTYAIVGHSERRAMGETDESISKKVQMLLDCGIRPILCVGEKERNDHGEHLDFLKNQIKNS